MYDRCVNNSSTDNEATRRYPPRGTEESRAHYRKVAELWRKAAEDDWRGPVLVEAGWQERAIEALERAFGEHGLA